ncbi:NIPSNAP family protein [Draconibacterium sp. IB214405]|uniref:NIPSNAP family protein n=1 Tax=Draconibacterium sp. IB214405 TaxID=3097352 RepID=UPI002A10F00E|nr:NIPSNAP family protein [Draconibacterium sp. IB214405]MDX8340636.1 NIPSNAP family protein [Draconibacterium sp. IB214405]
MKSNRILSTAIIIIALFSFSQLFAVNYYQIKVYNLDNPGQEERVDNYLKSTFLKAAHEAGIENVGVFKPIETDPDYGKKIFVLIPLKDLNDIVKLEDQIIRTELNSDDSDYINAAHDNPPFQRVETIILKAFSEMPNYHKPAFDTPKEEQIFQIRSYEGATEKLYRKKVEMFNEGGEVALFNDLGFNAVFFGEVLAGANMPNLIYMTSFKDIDSNKKLWEAFGSHPKWEELKNNKAYANTVSHIDNWLCHPTAYSDF